MIRKLFIPTLAALLLGGCVTGGYQYQGGPGDYYYGQPSVDYRYYGAPYYSAPYYSMPYGYYGYPGYYGYSSYGFSLYGFYGSGYPYYRNRYPYRGSHWRQNPGGHQNEGQGSGVNPDTNAPDSGIVQPRNRRPIQHRDPEVLGKSSPTRLPQPMPLTNRATPVPAAASAVPLTGGQSQSPVRDKRRIHTH